MNPESSPSDPGTAFPTPLPPPLPSPASGRARKGLPPWAGLLLGLAVLAGIAGFVLRITGTIRQRPAAGVGGEWTERMRAARQAPAPLTPGQHLALKTFGDTLATALSEADTEGVKALLDTRELAARVFSEAPDSLVNRQVLDGFVKGSEQRPGGWLWSILGNDVRCLRTRTRDGFPAVQLRVREEGGGVSFLDVLVRPAADGFKAVDLFNYMFATLMSVETRQFVLSALAASKGDNSVERWMARQKMDRELLQPVIRISTALQQGDAEKALRENDALPERLRKQRIIFLMRLHALMQLSGKDGDRTEEAYKKALREAPAILGPDSTTDMLLIDLQIMEGDFAAAEKGLRRTDEVVGGDAFLKVLMANLILKRGDVAAAGQLLREAEQLEPDLPDLIDLRLALLAAKKEFKALVDELRTFKEKYGVALGRDTLTETNVYGEFFASPEFQLWERENPAKEEPAGAESIK